MDNKKYSIASVLFVMILIASCSNDKSGKTEIVSEKSNNTSTEKPATVENKETSKTASTAEDGLAIATLETSDYILKIHRVVPFTLKPKSYEPIKVSADTKLAVLDISVRNKLSAPLNLSKILGMTIIKGKGGKNLLAPWVVAAYITDYPYPNHQKEYDALWSSTFDPNGFHRAMLLGLNPNKDEDEFMLIMPEKADYNSSKKEVKFNF